MNRRRRQNRSEMRGIVSDMTTAAVGIAGISMISKMAKKWFNAKGKQKIHNGI